MYEQEIDGNWLYPGDVLLGLKLPDLKKDDFHLISQRGDEKLYSVRSMMTYEHFVYLSHECDYNDNKRQFFILTPMVNIDMGLRRNDEAFQRLTESNDVKAHAYYLNLFYYAQFGLILPEDKVIDLTRVISFPANRKGELLEAKRLQLNDETRSLIKEKIAYYYLH